MWTTAVVTVDGDVVPCCYDKYAGHAMGNINGMTFSEIWSGEKFRSFRESVIKSRSSVDICANCPQGTQMLFRR
jgi:radical SAM protein with 4Fe4S-binding SPASM domain